MTLPLPRSAVKRKRCNDTLQQSGPPAAAARSEGVDVTLERTVPEPAAPVQPPQAPASLAGKLCTKPLQAYIAGGELSNGLRKRMQSSNAMLQTEGWAERPGRWKERPFSSVVPGSQRHGMTRTHYDKAFCAEWVSAHELAVSTKCGQVLRVDVSSGKISEAALPGLRWSEPAIATEDDLHRYRVDRGGIHCVRANASKNLLACSGGRGETFETYVLDLTRDKWQPVRRGFGHGNWVFCLSWVSDRSFVTGSRDKTVQLWAPYRGSSYDMQPAAVYNDVHYAKVSICVQHLHASPARRHHGVALRSNAHNWCLPLCTHEKHRDIACMHEPKASPCTARR